MFGRLSVQEKAILDNVFRAYFREIYNEQQSSDDDSVYGDMKKDAIRLKNKLMS